MSQLFYANTGNFVSGSWSSFADRRYTFVANDVGVWTITGLAAGAWLIGVGYTEAGNGSTIVNHEVLDNTTHLATVLVNQQISASSQTQYITEALGGPDPNNYASLGFYDLSTGTLVVKIKTTDGDGVSTNFCQAQNLYLTRVGPLGTISPLTGYQLVGGTQIQFLPNTTDPVTSSPVLAWHLVIPSGTPQLYSAGVDGFSGNVRLSRRFSVPNVSAAANLQSLVIARESGLAGPHTHYDGYSDLATAQVGASAQALSRYNSDSETRLGTVTGSAAFVSGHSLKHYIDVRGATSLTNVASIDVFLHDEVANTWLDDLGNMTLAREVPYVTAMDLAPIAGAGYTVLVSSVGTNWFLEFGVSTSAAATPGITPYADVRPDRDLRDTAGNLVQIHAGYASWDPLARLYYFVGIDCTGGTYTPGMGGFTDYLPIPLGVNLYSTPDLMNFTKLANPCRTTINGVTYSTFGRSQIHRHPTNGYWYILTNTWGPAGASDPNYIVILRGTNPAGPYTFFNRINLTAAAQSGDTTTFLDNDGSLYLLAYPNANAQVAISQFASDWSAIGATTNCNITGAGSAFPLEAWQMWRHGSDYCLGYSHQTGWSVNPNYIARASTIYGTYVNDPYPFTTAAAPNQANSYGTQASFVLVTPAGQTLWYADRWIPTAFIASLVMPFLVTYAGAIPTIPWTPSFVPAAAPPPAPLTSGGFDGGFPPILSGGFNT